MFGSGEGTRTHTVHALNVLPPAKLGYTTTFEIGTGEGTRTPTARSLKPLPPAIGLHRHPEIGSSDGIRTHTALHLKQVPPAKVGLRNHDGREA